MGWRRGPRRRRGGARRRFGSALLLGTLAVLAVVAVLATAGVAGVVWSAQPASAAPAPPASAAPALAAPAAATDAQLTVTFGDAGTFIPGRPAPVRIGIQADRLISGQLVVTAGSYQASQPVEVAGGSSKQLEMVVPTAVGLSPLQIDVAVTAHGAALARAIPIASAGPDTEVVGVLADLLVGRTLPGPAPLSVDAGTARFVAVSDQDLALAPTSLGPLSAIALGPDGLSILSPAVRQALLTWTAGGGRLLIDAQPGDTVAGLPAVWQPKGATRVSADLGQVVFTGGAMAAGQWAGLIDPTSHSTGTPNTSGIDGTSFLSTALAADAGLRSPRLPWLIGFLLLYIALVGPVSFFVLRRRRRPEMLWVVIPVLSLLFAGTGYAVGAAGRTVRVVHGTIVDTTLAGGSAVSYIAVLSAGQGTTRLNAPPGWVMQRYNDPQNPLPNATTVALRAAATSQGVEGRVSLDAGQFAVVDAAGPAGFSGRLAVVARSTADGGAEGTVTNQTALPLDDVSVLIGPEGADIGALAPGAQKSWRVSRDVPSSTGLAVESLLWGNSSLPPGVSGPFACVAPIPVTGFVGPGVVKGCDIVGGGSRSASTASVPIWGAGPVGLSSGTRPSGMAVAVGWTRGYQPPVTVAGHGRPSKGRTAIVGTAPVQPVNPLAALAIGRQVVRGTLTQVGPGMFVDTTNSGQPAMVAWQLPAAASGHQLSLAIPAGTAQVDVWSQGSWQHLTAGASGGGSASASSGPATTVAPANAGPPTKGVAPGALPTPITPPPVVAFGPAFPGQPQAPAATIGIDSGAVVNGMVYVRVGSGSFNQPINLDGLTLTVLP